MGVKKRRERSRVLKVFAAKEKEAPRGECDGLFFKYEGGGIFSLDIGDPGGEGRGCVGPRGRKKKDGRWQEKRTALPAHPLAIVYERGRGKGASFPL